MKSTILWALILLNAALLVLFIGRVTKDNSAIAQTPARRPGDYLAISGEITGGVSGLVYIVDQANGLLGAMSYDDSRGQIDVMPGVIDMSTIFDRNSQPANPAGARGR